MNKHPRNYDPVSAGVVFQGTMDEAIAQAKAWQPVLISDRFAHAPLPSNVIQFPVRK